MMLTVRRRKSSTKPVSQPPIGALHYSLDLEYALAEFLGMDSAWYNSAGGFADPRLVRDAIRAATGAIRKRARAIVTADDRLLLMIESKLGAIERHTKRINEAGHGLLEVLAGFVHLSALLLGYDWLVGKPNREVVYFQTREQQLRDDTKRHPKSALPVGRAEYETRLRMATQLFGEGLRVAQIARALNQPESLIKDILVRAGTIKRSVNVKLTAGE